MRLLRRPSTFSDVTAQAGADDVLPARPPTQGPRNDVVQTELRCGESAPAILTSVVVPREQVPTIELYFLFGKFCERQDADDARYGYLKAHGPDPVVLGRLELSSERAEFRPVLEVVRYVTAVFNTDDFGDGVAEVVSLEQ